MAAAIMLLAGCDRSTGLSGVRPGASPTVSAGVPMSNDPSTSPAHVLELAASPAPLPAGTYTHAAFLPPTNLDLDGTWTSVARFDDFFDVQQDVGSPDVVAVQLARPSGLVGRAGIAPAPADPGAAIELIRTNPGLAIIEESESRISGLVGRQATVENSSGAFVGVLTVAPGTVSIDTGRRLWMAFFATPHGLVGVLVGGSVATWDHALAVAEPVLESIRIGP